MTSSTRMFALAEDLNGATWYQSVYTHSHAWSVYLPVSFIHPPLVARQVLGFGPYRSNPRPAVSGRGSAWAV
jgi:hypothetical protein